MVRVQCHQVYKHQADWLDSDLHMNDPTSIILPLYEGRTCLPSPYNYTATCKQGAYPAYVVNVSTVAQILLAVNFARNLNLRLVVKNTGHDFNGKAAGKGALTIWTHYLKGKEYLPTYRAPNGYVGPAINFGSGVQVWEAHEFSKSVGHSIIGGEAHTPIIPSPLFVDPTLDRENSRSLAFLSLPNALHPAVRSHPQHLHGQNLYDGHSEATSLLEG
ncbi:FAD linked oxidaseN-terminal [Penicillium lividum]|nr:FAD linked oxidaseN-terminal [Penicillium lividum]